MVRTEPGAPHPIERAVQFLRSADSRGVESSEIPRIITPPVVATLGADNGLSVLAFSTDICIPVPALRNR
jgi:hypothetical protein